MIYSMLVHVMTFDAMIVCRACDDDMLVHVMCVFTAGCSYGYDDDDDDNDVMMKVQHENLTWKKKWIARMFSMEANLSNRI